MNSFEVMTVRELREKLFNVENQDAEVDILMDVEIDDSISTIGKAAKDVIIFNGKVWIVTNKIEKPIQHP